VIVGSALVQCVSDHLADPQQMAPAIGAMIADMKRATFQAKQQA